MRQALPKGFVQENVYLPGRRAIGFDYMRLQTDAASDSEVARQALRHFHQWALDEKHGIRLGFEKNGHERIFSLDKLRDPPDAAMEHRRTKLMFNARLSSLVRDELLAMIGAKDFSEVIRLALRFYKTIIRMSAVGVRFFVIMPDNGELFVIRFGGIRQSPVVSRIGPKPST